MQSSNNTNINGDEERYLGLSVHVSEKEEGDEVGVIGKNLGHTD